MHFFFNEQFSRINFTDLFETLLETDDFQAKSMKLENR